MTVAELKGLLNLFEDDKEVVIINDKGNFRSIEDVNNGYSCVKGEVIVID